MMEAMVLSAIWGAIVMMFSRADDGTRWLLVALGGFVIGVAISLIGGRP